MSNGVVLGVVALTVNEKYMTARTTNITKSCAIGDDCCIG